MIDSTPKLKGHKVATEKKCCSNRVNVAHKKIGLIILICLSFITTCVHLLRMLKNDILGNDSISWIYLHFIAHFAGQSLPWAHSCPAFKTNSTVKIHRRLGGSHANWWHCTFLPQFLSFYKKNGGGQNGTDFGGMSSWVLVDQSLEGMIFQEISRTSSVDFCGVFKLKFRGCSMLLDVTFHWTKPEPRSTVHSPASATMPTKTSCDLGRYECQINCFCGGQSRSIKQHSDV